MGCVFSSYHILRCSNGWSEFSLNKLISKLLFVKCIQGSKFANGNQFRDTVRRIPVSTVTSSNVSQALELISRSATTATITSSTRNSPHLVHLTSSVTRENVQSFHARHVHSRHGPRSQTRLPHQPLRFYRILEHRATNRKRDAGRLPASLQHRPPGLLCFSRQSPTLDSVITDFGPAAARRGLRRGHRAGYDGVSESGL